MFQVPAVSLETIEEVCRETTWLITVTDVFPVVDLAFLVDGAVHNMWHLEGVGATELWKSFDGTHALKSNDIERFVVPIDAEIKTDVKPHTAKRAQDWWVKLKIVLMFLLLRNFVSELSDTSLVSQTKLVEVRITLFVRTEVSYIFQVRSFSFIFLS